MVFDYASWLSDRYPEVGYRSFYRDLFPSGSLQLERDVQVKGQYPAIAVRACKDGSNLRYTVTDDLSAIDEIVASAEPGDLCVMSPVTYAGKTQRKSMAHAMHAMVFDLDGLIVKDDEPEGALQLVYQMTDILGTASANFALPVPTYIVSSGSGLHLYYLLDEPLILTPYVIDRVEVFRKALTRKIWNAYITDFSDKPEYEGSTQGFRMVGTPIKEKHGTGVVRAFLTGDRVATEYLDGFVLESERMGVVRATRSATPIDEAKEKWPEWHQKRVVQGVPRKTWRNKTDLYEWWKRRVIEEGAAGHRYWCIVSLAAYAKKCGIDHDQLVRDAEELRVVLDGRRRDGEDDVFTKKDVEEALTAFRNGMIMYSIEAISARTGIPIVKNKRNGRKQVQHMAVMRAIQNVTDPDGHWRNKNGAPTKRDLILLHASSHPGATQREIAEALGVSPTTVNKWLKTENGGKG